METTVRAACPKCKTALRIPTQWVGKTVRCKSCGAAVRTRPPGENGAAEPLPIPVPVPAGHIDPLPAAGPSFVVPHPVSAAFEDEPDDTPVIARAGAIPAAPAGGTLLRSAPAFCWRWAWSWAASRS